MGKIIAVANQKGGVGKTTTTVNLAACIAEKGYNVLLVDLDPQGNATSGCGINKKRLELNVYSALESPENAAAAVVKTKFGGLSIMPSHMALAGAELEMVDIEGREKLLKNAIAPVKDSYDFIFIDCPPSLGLLTVNALTAADSVLIPIQCEFYALEGLSQLTNTIKQVNRLYNPSLDIEGVLVTMYDARLNLTVQVLSEVKRFFYSKMYKTCIPRNVKISEAPSHGAPINYYDKSAKGTVAYRALAEEFLNNNKGRKED